MMTKNAHGFSRPPLQRMMRLHAQLKAGAFPNCRKMAEELEVSPKTIQRDIDFMRDRLGLPIAYEPLRFGFRYTEAVSAFPNIEVSEGEITALFVAQKALAQYRGTPFEKPLQSAFRKITESLKDRVSFSWTELDDVISFRSAGASVGDLQLFETLSNAVLRSVEVEFEYRKLTSSVYEWRLVEPYHLASVENQWYLFAFDPTRAQLRTFALPRMRHVATGRRRFRRPADFSLAKMLSESFGVFSGSGKHRVRLWFDPFAARLVSERTWHDSQRIRTARDGSITIEFQLGGLEEIERWILSWGSHVRALGPRALVERVESTARAVLSFYDRSTATRNSSAARRNKSAPAPRSKKSP
ncbi:MAG: WYL domain-containing protein [Verrucomicrobiota bacterium]|nr:WYL domain-containing protein [Verrucomicrobiota bacterium]